MHRESFDFDSVAAIYDSVRPSYPKQLIDLLSAEARLTSSSRVLEIGCGSGQATLALASIGCSVTALDRGQHLIQLARKNLAAYPNVEFERVAFEDWEPNDQPAFEIVFAATSIHWMDPHIAIPKIHRLLRPGGLLVIVSTHHVKGGSEEFFDQSRSCYDRWGPQSLHGFRLCTADEIQPYDTLLPALFRRSCVRRVQVTVHYPADDYIRLLSTYSDHARLPDSECKALLDCLRGLILASGMVGVDKRYLFELATFERISSEVDVSITALETGDTETERFERPNPTTPRHS